MDSRNVDIDFGDGSERGNIALVNIQKFSAYSSISWFKLILTVRKSEKIGLPEKGLMTVYVGSYGTVNYKCLVFNPRHSSHVLTYGMPLLMSLFLY